MEIWLRPWARFQPSRRLSVGPGGAVVPADHRGAVLLHVEGAVPPIDGSVGGGEVVARMAGGQESLVLLPFGLRRKPGIRIGPTGRRIDIAWPDAPEKLSDGKSPSTPEEVVAHLLMLRAKAVWDRIADVDELLADPARLWSELRQRWTSEDPGQPQMDVIVRQARDLARVIDGLMLRPRRILRRVHRTIPVGRVQEVDRRSMLWLARQPGETLAERAGDDQRVLAVAREENFDTLENRVLRAYGELAARRGLDYLERNQSRGRSVRARLVEAFVRKCRRMARDLAGRGVQAAEAGVTPNFVLQQNPAYHEVWMAWIELLLEKRKEDDLWRWQARSWEEFCSLAVVVALAGQGGARPVATSPIWFRDEHFRGQWIEADAPLAVIHLPAQGLIVELARGSGGGGQAAGFGAPLWLRVGRVGETQGFLSRVPIWPLWSPWPSLCPGEAREVADVVARGRADLIRGGIVIRPAGGAGGVEAERSGSVLAVTLGTDGEALREGLAAITRHLEVLFEGAAS